MTTLREKMTPQQFFGRKCHAPMIKVSFGIGEKWTLAFNGVVDSGSTITLATMDVASALGLTEDQLCTKPIRTLEGAGGSSFFAYEWEANLRLTNSVGAKVRRTLDCENAKVFFTKKKLPYYVLLGQYDLLERYFYIQRYLGSDPEFILHDDLPRRQKRN